MLVLAGFFMLTFVGGVLSGGKPPPPPPTCKPNGNKCADKNAVFKDCPRACPLTCAEPKPQPCNKMCLKNGCECAPGFVLTEIGGKCIKLEDCPVPCCPKNSHYVINDKECIKTCGNRLLPGANTAGACAPYTGCVCDDCYVRKYDNGTGPCIPKRKCPPIPKKCGLNEQRTSCRIKCPPQTCDSIFTTYDCPEPACEPGCDCIDNHLRNADGVCIRSEDCNKPTECGPNEVLSDCKIVCPPQSCESLYTTYMCAEGNCTIGCNCINAFLRNKDEICIPSEQCGQEPCNGDLNATRVECGTACPSTCAQPDTNRPCILICVLNACECKPGYILTDTKGVCISPRDCPGGSPVCGANKTYVDCYVGCPSNYCPADDSRAVVACSAPYPCPGGCACKPGYLIEKQGSQRCILSEECPPVTCTRPNEVWNPKPSNCYSERCEDMGRVCDNPYPTPPRCVCQVGYFRNTSDVCVPASECPDYGCNGDLNATYSTCTSACPASCADLYSDDPRMCIALCMEPGCQCKPDYILGANGKCIKTEDCPKPGCNGDPNAVYSNCSSACPPTCANPGTNQGCIAVCREGCVCKPRFVLEKKGGKCIDPKNCPVGCNGDPHAIYSDCTSACPPTCNSDPNQICTEECRPPGCVCIHGYVFDKKGGKCINPKNCPVGCNGDPNAVFSDCTSACPPTCNSDPKQICTDECRPPGCVCKPGYVLEKKGGKCIDPKCCPAEPQCNGDRNATFTDCPSPCQATCDEPNSNVPCIRKCLPPGCICKPGYLRAKKNGQCINPKDCPGGSPTCKKNETYVYCKIGCPDNFCPVDDSLAIVVCEPIMFSCPGGCACKGGYLRISYEDQRCILSSECPRFECTRPNEIFEPNPPSCLRERCTDLDGDPGCNFIRPNAPRCICKKGYYRNESDICIPVSQCRISNCGYNEIAVPCRQICPPQNCEIAYTDYACTDETKKCEPGCNCLPDHLRNGSGICIPNDKCPYPSTPVCGINEIARDCRRICPPQTCISKYAFFRCLENIPCEPGCDCIPYYLRDNNGVCIPSENCPPPCPIPEECKRTCLRPNPPNCDYREPPKTNIDGCECKEGYILSKTGVCIKIEDCPNELGCDGDPHARTKLCPAPCPSTCQAPNAVQCRRRCDPIGCECDDGYILSNSTGICILPDQCPGGNPCGKGGRFVSCRVTCPRDYCPVDDSRDIILCDPPSPCPSGCICDLNHKRKSIKDPQCIVSSDCPPVCCTRPNEVWDSCPSACLAEDCEDVNNQPATCNTFVLNCEPQCICKEGYFRNSKGICIPAANCPC